MILYTRFLYEIGTSETQPFLHIKDIIVITMTSHDVTESTGNVSHHERDKIFRGSRVKADISYCGYHHNRKITSYQ